MTVKELFELIRDRIKKHPTDANRNVCIPNNKIGLGGTKVTDVKDIGFGIDWDAGKCFIWPEKKMQEIGIEPVKIDHIFEAAYVFATKEMKKSYGEDWQFPMTSTQMGTTLSWMKMFIRDQFNMFSKY